MSLSSEKSAKRVSHLRPPYQLRVLENKLRIKPCAGNTEPLWGELVFGRPCRVGTMTRLLYKVANQDGVFWNEPRPFAQPYAPGDHGPRSNAHCPGKPVIDCGTRGSRPSQQRWGICYQHAVVASRLPPLATLAGSLPDYPEAPRGNAGRRASLATRDLRPSSDGDLPLGAINLDSGSAEPGFQSPPLHPTAASSESSPR